MIAFFIVDADGLSKDTALFGVTSPNTAPNGLSIHPSRAFSSRPMPANRGVCVAH
jgi:hypothetical protein